jgi:NifU-like protein involved in Fe-S cluster formation
MPSAWTSRACSCECARDGSRTIAASSAATELIRGAALADVLELADAQVTAAVGGLPPDRAHAAQVVTAAIRAAARDAVARYETTSPEGE